MRRDRPGPKVPAVVHFSHHALSFGDPGPRVLVRGPCISYSSHLVGHLRPGLELPIGLLALGGPGTNRSLSSFFGMPPIGIVPLGKPDQGWIPQFLWERPWACGKAKLADQIALGKQEMALSPDFPSFQLLIISNSSSLSPLLERGKRDRWEEPANLA